MRPRTTAYALLFATLLCFALPRGASGQQQRQWTWKDRDGKVRSRADLDKILAEHKLWLVSNFRSGAGADLSGADLQRGNLSGTDLTGADLRRRRRKTKKARRQTGFSP